MKLCFLGVGLVSVLLQPMLAHAQVIDNEIPVDVDSSQFDLASGYALKEQDTLDLIEGYGTSSDLLLEDSSNESSFDLNPSSLLDTDFDSFSTRSLDGAFEPDIDEFLVSLDGDAGNDEQELVNQYSVSYKGESEFNVQGFKFRFSKATSSGFSDGPLTYAQAQFDFQSPSLLPSDSNTVILGQREGSDVPDSVNLPDKEPLAPDLPVEESPEETTPQESKSTDLEPSAEGQDKNYKLPPQVADPQRVQPLLTLFPLNDVPISHLSRWEVGLGTEFGNQTDTNVLGDGFYTIKSQVKQSLSIDNLFVSKQTGYYLQAKTIKANRSVTTEAAEPITLNGFQIQQSFIGSCALVGVTLPNDAQCSFTPGLVTDRNSIDPETILPTRILTLGNLGDVVSDESLGIIAQPGFQGIGENGQTIGLDLFFPNTGSIPGNSFSTETQVDRDEDLDYRPALSFNRVYQIYKSNDEKAKLGRTIYGVTGLFIGRNREINWPVQAVAQGFPKFNPVLKGNPEKDAIFEINKNLILAANNVRTPEDSFVFYHGGISSAKHRSKKDKKLPKGVFNSLWFGLSPVTERSLSTSIRLEATGATEIIAEGGGEGGANTDISFNSIINQGGLVQNLDSANLTDFYTQIYLAFLQTPANSITTTTVSEEVTYHPHLSASGDITDERQVLRYYSGVIAKDDPIAYLGSDYTREILKDLRLNLGLIGYINPDREYYSRANGRLAKTFRFASDKSLTLASSFLYVFDRPQDGLDVTLNDPIDNFVTLSLKSRFGPLTAGVTQFFDVLPDSTPTSTGADVSLLLGKSGSSISGYILPQNNIMNYGIQAQLKLRRKPNAPALSFVWNRARFDFGTDPGGNVLNTSEDKFVIFLRFGRPDDPFSPRRIVAPATSS